MTAPNDVGALVERLALCANDPMWADHAEVPKTLLSAAASALEASEAKIAALTAENTALREERHLADNALVDRYRDPKTGSFQFPTDVAAIVRRLDAAEADNAAMREALRPFSEAARAFTSTIAPDGIDDGLAVVAHLHCRRSIETVLSTTDFSRAHAALRQEGKL